MRLVHLSDLHLGHRAFGRRDRGANTRERDLAGAFHAAIHEIGILGPDLVILSGDLFNHPDPPSTAFLTLTRGIQRLQELLPGVPIVAIAGEADTPMAKGDPGPVAVLDAIPGVEAASGAPRSVHLRRLGAHLLLVPHRAVVAPPFPELRPDPGARWNILVARGWPEEERSRDPRLVLDPTGWDYVALGGPHRARRWASGVHSAGALERIGADPWREGGVEMGFLVVDLLQKDVHLHPVPGRPVVDLAPVKVSAGEPEVGSRRLRELLEGFPGGVDGKILRIRLRGDILTPSEGISIPLLAGIRRRAAHLEIRIEPAMDRSTSKTSQSRPPQPRVPQRLNWRVDGVRTGSQPLHPGLWLLTAPMPDDRARWIRAVEGLRRGEVREGDKPARIALSLDPPLPAGGTPGATLGAGKGEVEPLAAEGIAEKERRADWIEAAGDAEARALEWARDRQEADSRLLAYRERAKELRDRIRVLREEGPEARCPTCHRPLATAHPNLLALLEEEWEGVVQDGSWWKRRRTQLEEKPADLLELERRALQLQSALGAGPIEAKAGAEEGGELHGSWPRESLRRAALLLQRATEGRLLGLIPTPEGLQVEDARGDRSSPTLGEVGLVSLALEAAALHQGSEEPPAVSVLAIPEETGPPEAVARLLRAALAEMEPRVWIAVVSEETAEHLGTELEGGLELLQDEQGRHRLRTLPAGRATMRLVR